MGIQKHFKPFVLCALALALVACSETETAQTEPEQVEESAPIATEVQEESKTVPTFIAVSEETVTSEVAAINQETREVSLIREDGTQIDFVASDRVKNLAQVEIGDVVTMTTVNSLSFELLDAASAERISAEGEAIATAEEGQKPGVAAIQKTVDVLEVTAIDMEANTFKLKDVDGYESEYTARNPENLKLAKVGDFLAVTMTEMLAIDVTKKSAE